MREDASETTGSGRLQLSSRKLAQMIDISAVQAFHNRTTFAALQP